MDDAGRVRGGKTVGDLRGQVERLAERYRTAADEVAQRLALDQFGHDVGDAVVVAGIVEGHDVGMSESRGGAPFLLEAAAPVGALGELGRQDLNRDIAAEAGIVGAVDLAHGALAQLGGDLILTQAGARFHRHGNQL